MADIRICGFFLSKGDIVLFRGGALALIKDVKERQIKERCEFDIKFNEQYVTYDEVGRHVSDRYEYGRPSGLDIVNVVARGVSWSN